LAEDTSVEAGGTLMDGMVAPRSIAMRRAGGSRPRMTEAQKRTAKLLRLADAAAIQIEQVDRLRRLLRPREQQARVLRRERELQAGLTAEIAQLVAEEEAAARVMAKSLAVLDRFIAGQGLAVNADALLDRVLELRRVRRQSAYP
jgi:hypothetical protein